MLEEKLKKKRTIFRWSERICFQVAADNIEISYEIIQLIIARNFTMTITPHFLAILATRTIVLSSILFQITFK